MNHQKKNSTATIAPELQDQNFTREAIIGHIGQLIQQPEPIPHGELLATLLNRLEPVNFNALAELGEDQCPNNKQLHVLVIEQVLHFARKYQWAICRYLDFIYVFNGAY